MFYPIAPAGRIALTGRRRSAMSAVVRRLEGVSASGQTMSHAPKHLETAQSLTGATTGKR